MSRPIYVTVFAALLTLPSIAAAETGTDFGSLDDIDRNGDGAISLDEMRQQRASSFASLDTDRNRLLDRGEMAAAREQFALPESSSRGSRRGQEIQNRMFARADGNGDNMLSQHEFMDAAAPLFSRLDRNKDGLITTEEREALSKRLRRMHR